jgi:uncharacterized protein YdeI (YjbR/CyaY-like superfamily)
VPKKASTTTGPETEILKFASQSAWAEWLAQHHANSPGVFIQVAKSGSGHPSVTCPEALDVALCYGWIDSLRRGLDAEWFLQKYGPRKSASLWSKINCDKVQSLIDQGLMQPSGFAAIEVARKNGRWESAYEGPSKIAVPPDLQAELDRRPEAAAFFAKLKSQNRFAILFRLQTARKPETRLARLEKFIGMLERGETIY